MVSVQGTKKRVFKYSTQQPWSLKHIALFWEPVLIGGQKQSGSQEFSDFVKMSLFEVVQSWEKSVEILSQVQHLLTDFNNVFLFRFGRLNQLMHNFGRNERIPLKLLTNFESHIEGSNCN